MVSCLGSCCVARVAGATGQSAPRSFWHHGPRLFRLIRQSRAFASPVNVRLLQRTVQRLSPISNLRGATACKRSSCVRPCGVQSPAGLQSPPPIDSHTPSFPQTAKPGMDSGQVLQKLINLAQSSGTAFPSHIQFGSVGFSRNRKAGSKGERQASCLQVHLRRSNQRVPLLSWPVKSTV